VSQTVALSPTGIVGYGFPEQSFETGLQAGPQIIGCDGGSTDQGPGDLGRGTLHVSRDACYRDLELMITGSRRLGIPLLVGTAGGAGAAPHVEAMRELIAEIARKRRLHFSLAIISSDVSKGYLHDRLNAGEVEPLDGGAPLDHETVESCDRIVGVMGAEPYQEGLRRGADVIIAGRSSDTAIFAAVPLMNGEGPGQAWHAGKILECGASAAVPMAATDCLLAWVGHTGFEVAPCNPELGCTPISVAAHTMYENESPYLLREPSGTLDTRRCKFISVDSRRVKVIGSAFAPAPRYSIKLEAVRMVGYRTICIGVSRDPALIAEADLYIENVRKAVADRVADTYGSGCDYQLEIREIGKNAAMGPLEPHAAATGHEIGLLLSVVAPTQQQADAILAMARTHALHAEVSGRQGLLSNLAFPFAPTDIPAGPVHVFALNHVVFPRSPTELFPVRVEQL
jgi:Acyclic terpene utilisation family protein AtuA